MTTDLLRLGETLSARPHELLEPTSNLHSSLLFLAKQYFDPLASSISDAQSQRQQEERLNKKRKRALDDHDGPREQLLRMKQVHINGFAVQQVWQQARRILKATNDEVQRTGSTSILKERGSDHAMDLDRSEDSLGEEGVDFEIEGTDDDLDAVFDPSVSEDEGSLAESSPDIGAETPLSDVSDNGEAAQDLVRDKHGLNDGFFSIDQFNKQSEFLEHQDAKGDPNDGAASDEEDIDWTLDPLAGSASIPQMREVRPKRLKTTSGMNSDEEDSIEDEDGPTFGGADLNAPDTDDEAQDDDAGDDDDLMAIGGEFGNTNDIRYADFFAPPARQKAPTDRRKRHKLTSTVQNDTIDDDDNAEINRAMADVHRDIFDDAEDEDAISSGSDSEAAKASNKNLSTHEKRLAAFRKEIAKLERENVSKKHWALTGETLAPSRPENALLEEDLDFERAGKPVPVITNEVNESIEELIKRRILNGEFDELPRRRPELHNVDGSSRRGLVDRRKDDLSDAKPTRGLADEYADDYLRKNDPNYVDSRSQATKAAHAAISSQWAELSAQLDSLSNYHYKPKPPEKSLEIRTDAAVVEMEEARPAAGAEANTSGLAPQEVYKVGSEGRKPGEIVTTGGTNVAKEEETRESKRRRRRREKTRSKKAGGPDRDVLSTSGSANKNTKGSSKKADHSNVVNALKKGDVKVIGKKGELRDVEGKVASSDAGGGRNGTARYRL